MYVARSLKKVASGPGTGSGNTALDLGFGYITQCINYFPVFCFLFVIGTVHLLSMDFNLSFFFGTYIGFTLPFHKRLAYLFFLLERVRLLPDNVMCHDVCHDLSSCKKWPAPCTHRRRVQAEGFGHFRVSRPTPWGVGQARVSVQVFIVYLLFLCDDTYRPE